MSRHGLRWAATAGGCMLVLAGCGASNDYANDPRPPAPITVTASIGAKRILVSPAHFGAGPVTLVVTNQTDRSRELVLESNQAPGSGKTGLAAQDSGPINPQGTASLKADLDPGTYVVRVKDGGVRDAQLVVGPKRESAQNQLLQP